MHALIFMHGVQRVKLQQNALFQVVGRDYDRNDIAEDEAEVYESIYSLLTAISPSYQHTFSEAVTSKLNQLVDTDHW